MKPTESGNQIENPETGGSFRKGVGWLVEVSAYIVVCLAIVAFLDQYHWIIDLLAQFRVQYAIVLFLGAIISLARRRIKTLAIFATFFLINGWTILPWYFAPETAGNTGQHSLRVAMMNVLTSNRQFEEVVQFVRSQNPDIFVAIEVNQEWVDQLQAGLTDLPHSNCIPRSDNFGIAIFSNFEMMQVQDMLYGPFPIESLKCTFVRGDKHFQLVATHPLPALSHRHWKGRKEQLAGAVADLNPDFSRILVGDFNLTPWSSHFRDVTRGAELRSAGLGYGPQPTWHIFPGWLGGLKIDHVLVSEDLAVSSHVLSPHLGSDHRAIVVELEW